VSTHGARELAGREAAAAGPGPFDDRRQRQHGDQFLIDRFTADYLNVEIEKSV
jgi:hypothetical protein